MKRNEVLKEMSGSGFEMGLESSWEKLNDDLLEKKYKCFLSWKCNNLKFERIKLMFKFGEKFGDEFVNFMGKENYESMKNSYGEKNSRGVVVKKSYNGLDVLDVFMNEKLGVKEIMKKGYIVDMSVDSKGMGVYRNK